MIEQLKSKIAIVALVASFVFPVSAHSQEFMTQKELLSTIPGNTLYGISNSDGKTRWVQNYGKGRKKGKIAGLFGKDQYQSKWFVKGNQWCEDWGTGSGCFLLERVGENKFRTYVDGKPQKNLWKLK